MKETISILGCGWYGLPLAIRLINEGYKVKGSTTNVQKLTQLQSSGIQPYLIEAKNQILQFEPSFFDSDILIICIPPKRSSSEQHTFPEKIQNIAAAARAGKISRTIFISSTSVYADTSQAVNETDQPQPSTPSGKAMILAENILKSENSFKTTVIRFAGLVGPGRDPARFFAGKQNIPNGQAPVNLIHLKDCIGLTLAVLEQAAFDLTINGVSPDHPQKQDFYTAAAKKNGLEAPSFLNELNDWKIVANNHIPAQIKYQYQIIDWMASIEEDKI